MEFDKLMTRIASSVNEVNPFLMAMSATKWFDQREFFATMRGGNDEPSA